MQRAVCYEIGVDYAVESLIDQYLAVPVWDVLIEITDRDSQDLMTLTGSSRLSYSGASTGRCRS